jgi:hypothetical protein
MKERYGLYYEALLLIMSMCDKSVKFPFEEQQEMIYVC